MFRCASRAQRISWISHPHLSSWGLSLILPSWKLIWDGECSHIQDSCVSSRGCICHSPDRNNACIYYMLHMTPPCSLLQNNNKERLFFYETVWHNHIQMYQDHINYVQTILCLLPAPSRLCWQPKQLFAIFFRGLLRLERGTSSNGAIGKRWW